MKKIILGAMIAVVAGAGVFWMKNQEIQLKILRASKEAEEISLNIEVAHTPTKRTKGLSGREDLGKNEGMLFVFEREDYYGFWMKDMNFPIDIAWLGSDKKIIHIKNSVSPGTYPTAFVPPVPARYVLETAAGFFEEHEIKIGDLAEF